MTELIKNQLPTPELLAQLAEEAAELSQAALKLRRVLDGKNPTPTTYEQALDNLQEEIADVTLILDILDLDVFEDTYNRMTAKLARWVNRLTQS